MKKIILLLFVSILFLVVLVNGGNVNFTANFDNCPNGNNGSCAGFVPLVGDWITESGEYKAIPSTLLHLSAVPGINCANCTFASRVKTQIVPFGSLPGEAGVIGRFVNTAYYYILILDFTNNKIKIVKAGGGALTEVPYMLAQDVYYLVSLKIKGNNLTGFIDGVPVISTIDNNPILSGTGGLYTIMYTTGPKIFDDFSIVSIGEEVIQPTLNISGSPNLGNTINISLSASSHSNQDYIVAFSSSTNPGFTLSNGLFIPLTPNSIFIGSIFYPSIFGLTNSQGLLDSQGIAQATFTVPNIPVLAFFTIHFAFVTINQTTQEVTAVSPAVPVTMLP